MPEALPESDDPAAIDHTMERVWQSTTPPLLDLSAHEPQRVAGALVSVYRALLETT